jgi:hypothetical protein
MKDSTAPTMTAGHERPPVEATEHASTPALDWTLITGPCQECGAVGTCFHAGRAVACRFAAAQGEKGRVHVGRTPPNTATYALFNLSHSTPEFPGAIPEFTWIRGID